MSFNYLLSRGKENKQIADMTDINSLSLLTINILTIDESALSFDT